MNVTGNEVYSERENELIVSIGSKMQEGDTSVRSLANGIQTELQWASDHIEDLAKEGNSSSQLLHFQRVLLSRLHTYRSAIERSDGARGTPRAGGIEIHCTTDRGIVL